MPLASRWRRSVKEPYAANGPGCRTAKFITLGQNSMTIGVIRTMAYERCTNRKPALSALSSTGIHQQRALPRSRQTSLLGQRANPSYSQRTSLQRLDDFVALR